MPHNVVSDDILEHLVELVREQPAIYDNSRKDHKDTILMSNLCKSIGAALNIDGKDGITMRTKGEPDESERINYAPFTLFPTTFPKELFDFAKEIQTDVNLLIHRVAHDHKYLEKILQGTVEVDDFTRRLWNIYVTVKAENSLQPISVGVFRSDYMVNYDADSTTPTLKQIEVNTISASFFGLANQVADLHRYTLNQAGYESKAAQIPENQALKGIAAGLIKSWELYGNNNAVILFLVEMVNRNIFDQRWLEFELYAQRKDIKVIRRNFIDIYEHGSLTEDRRLIVDSHEVGLVYFRCGYAPADFFSDKDWDVRLMMERAKALKCPSIQYQLTGAKKVQQELSKPGAVERFFPTGDSARKIRETFAAQFGLELGSDGDAAVALAMKHPEKYVMKPQSEGGGNNLYGADIVKELGRLGKSTERSAYILMERIFPRPQQNVLLRPDEPVHITDVISEYGVFGVIIGSKDAVIHNTQDGHLLRTKQSGMTEGGVALGFAVIDTPLPVD